MGTAGRLSHQWPRPLWAVSRLAKKSSCLADLGYLVRLGNANRTKICRRFAACPAATEGGHRVVVTGLGVVSSLGCDTATFYDNLCAGVSGIGPIEAFECEGWSTRFAGEVRGFDPGELIAKKMARRLDRSIQFSLVAGKKALLDAGLPLHVSETPQLDPLRAGTLVGSAMGGMATFAAGAAAALESHRKMNPFCVPFAITNMSSAMLAIDTGFMGPNYSISTACATGNYCMLSAVGHIRRGEADVMLAGASDAAVVPAGIGGFIACKALSRRNDDPARASRPWDKGRDGFVMGEGAGVLVLESAEHAEARGARIYAELVGGATNCDAHHITEPRPDGAGVRACVELALKRTGVAAKEVGYVNAHGTSTQAGDMAEYRAITAALAGGRMRVNSTKSMIGHLLGGASGVEGVATVLALHNQRLHPNLNLEDPEDEVSMDVLVGRHALEHEFDIALSNSFGFGGHNSSVVFRRWQGL